MTVSWRRKATELTNQHWLKCSLNDIIGQRKVDFCSRLIVNKYDAGYIVVVVTIVVVVVMVLAVL